eukprot:m.10697 g.10697  ORF g.10697 m.10697 type:complete len:360 (+) comp22567_c0_seq2:166-1245(+)
MNNSSLTNIGIPLYGDSWEYYVGKGFACLCAITAVILCIAVLAVAALRPKSRTTTNLFIFNLAAVTIFQGVSCFAFSLLSTLTDSYHSVTPESCTIAVILSLYATSVTMWACAAASIERCDVLTRPLTRWMTRAKAWTVIAFTWALSLAVTIPATANSWAQIEYMTADGELACFLNPLRSPRFVIFWSVSGVLAPVAIVVGCFAVIAWVICRKAKTRRSYLAGQSAKEHSKGNFNEIEAQALKITFVVIIVNIVLVVPFVVVLLMKLDVQENAMPQVVTGIMMNVAIVIDAILFAFGVRSIRKEVAGIWCCRCFGRDLGRSMKNTSQSIRSTTTTLSSMTTFSNAMSGFSVTEDEPSAT